MLTESRNEPCNSKASRTLVLKEEEVRMPYDQKRNHFAGGRFAGHGCSGGGNPGTPGGPAPPRPGPAPRLPDPPRRPEGPQPIEEPDVIPPEVPNPIGDPPPDLPEPKGPGRTGPTIGAAM